MDLNLASSLASAAATKVQSYGSNSLNSTSTGGGSSYLNNNSIGYSSPGFESGSFISRPSPQRVLPSVGNRMPSTSGGSFSITPDQLLRPPRPKDENRDLMNQSFSFKMLNKWIADSETTSAPLFKSKQDEEEEREKMTASAQIAKKSEGK